MSSNPTFDELVELIAQTIESPIDAYIDKKLERAIAKSLAEVEGLKDFLRATLAADMRRYFSASPEEQQTIKGAYGRTVYLLGLARSGGELQK